MEKKSGMCPLGDESPPLLSRSEATPPCQSSTMQHQNILSTQVRKAHDGPHLEQGATVQ